MVYRNIEWYMCSVKLSN